MILHQLKTPLTPLGSSGERLHSNFVCSSLLQPWLAAAAVRRGGGGALGGMQGSCSRGLPLDPKLERAEGREGGRHLLAQGLSLSFRDS